MVSNVGRTLDDFSIPSSQRTTSEDLGQEDFLKLMVEQMRNQNPLDPQDNSEFFSQIAQFQTLCDMGLLTLCTDADALEKAIHDQPLAAVLHMEKEDLIEDFLIAYQEALGEIGFTSRDIARMAAAALAV